MEVKDYAPEFNQEAGLDDWEEEDIQEQMQRQILGSRLLPLVKQNKAPREGKSGRHAGSGGRNENPGERPKDSEVLAMAKFMLDLRTSSEAVTQPIFPNHTRKKKPVRKQKRKKVTFEFSEDLSGDEDFKGPGIKRVCATKGERRSKRLEI